MKIRSQFIKLFLFVLVAVIVLSGCTKKSTTSSKVNPKEEVTLTMWQLFDDENVWKPIIQDFERENKNVKIKYVKKSYADYTEDSLDALASRTGPDIWMIRNDWLPQHIDKLVSAPKDILAAENVKQQFPDVVYNDTVVGDAIYGVPMSVDTLVLYYNRSFTQDKRQELDRSDDFNISNSEDLRRSPVTWNDAVRYAKLLERREKNQITRSGLALGATNVDRNEDILAALMLQNNTQMVSSDRKSAGFNLSRVSASGQPIVPGRAALEFFQSFSDPNSNRYTWPTSFPTSVEAFKQGKVAMIINYGFLQNTLEQEAPTLDFGIWPLPQIDGSTQIVDYANYWLETVTNSSKYPELAWQFLNFAAQKSNEYAQAATRPDNSRPNIDNTPKTILERAEGGDPLNFQKLTAQSWYKGKRAWKTDLAFRLMIQSITDGEDPSRALDTAAKRVTELLQSQTSSTP